MRKLLRLKIILLASILTMTSSVVVNADQLTVAGKTYVGIDLGNPGGPLWGFVFGDVGVTSEFSIFPAGAFFDDLVYDPGEWQEIQDVPTVSIFQGDITAAKPDLDVSFQLKSVFLTDLGLIPPPSTAMFGNLNIAMVIYIDIGTVKIPIIVNIPKPFLMIEIVST